MHRRLQGYLAEGAVGVKIALAYRRIIRFEKVAKADAERLFNRISSHLGEGLSWEEARPLQDFLVHESIRAAIEGQLPLQLHTGLHEAIETVPANKLFAFGGDFIIPEGAYGHSVLARQVVSQVLAEKVEHGSFNEDEALRLGRRMLRENPAEIYRLKV